MRNSTAGRAIQLLSSIVGISLMFLIPSELLIDTATIVVGSNASTSIITCGVDGHQHEIITQPLLSERYSGQSIIVHGVVGVVLCFVVLLASMRCFFSSSISTSVSSIQRLFSWWQPMLRQSGELFFQACVCVQFSRGVAHPVPLLVWATVILVDGVVT